MTDLQLCFNMDADPRRHLEVTPAVSPVAPIAGRARQTDPQTSHDAARKRSKRYKWGSLRHYLLEVYAAADGGLTDEEASQRAQIFNGGWKRCSELRSAGFIEYTGETRTTSAGVQAQCCAITNLGTYALRDIRRARRKAS